MTEFGEYKQVGSKGQVLRSSFSLLLEHAILPKSPGVYQPGSSLNPDLGFYRGFIVAMIKSIQPPGLPFSRSWGAGEPFGNQLPSLGGVQSQCY